MMIRLLMLLRPIKRLRGLAHATRTFENPADTYRGLDEVSGSVRLLRQVLDQLSRAHADHRAIAFTDDGGGWMWCPSRTRRPMRHWS